MGAALAFALLLVGCGSSLPDTCDELAELHPAQRMPLAGMLAGPADALSRALAQAAGDPVTDGPRAATDSMGRPVTHWDTAEGGVDRYEDGAGNFQALRWWSARQFTPLDGSSAKSDITSILDAIGLKPSQPPWVELFSAGQLDIDVRLLYQGMDVLDRNGSTGVSASEREMASASDGSRAEIDIGQFFDLSHATMPLSQEDAEVIAPVAVRCLHGVKDPLRAVHNTPNYQIVFDGRLGYEVDVVWGDACEMGGAVRVVVDAVTGAILDPGVVGTGCIKT